MAQTSADVANQINGLFTQTQQFDPNYNTTVKNAVNQQVQGFQPQWNELSGVQRNAYQVIPKGFADYQQANPNGYQAGQGVDPLQYIKGLLGNYNGQMQRADTLRNTIGQLGGTVQDIAGSVSDMYKNGMDNIYKQIGTLQPIYSTLNANEQAQIQRAQEAKQFEEQLAEKANEAKMQQDYQQKVLDAQGTNWDAFSKANKDSANQTINGLPDTMLPTQKSMSYLTGLGGVPIGGNQYKMPNGRIITLRDDQPAAVKLGGMSLPSAFNWLNNSMPVGSPAMSSMFNSSPVQSTPSNSMSSALTSYLQNKR